nr:MAG TPA: RING finger and CHY zinc-binding protein, Metal-binding, Nucleus, Zinc-finger [Caudoviricetes sp.]
METVYCPVLNRQVDGTTCLEIVLVTDREIKASTLPKEIEWSEEVRAKCLSCPYHDDLD